MARLRMALDRRLERIGRRIRGLITFKIEVMSRGAYEQMIRDLKHRGET